MKHVVRIAVVAFSGTLIGSAQFVSAQSSTIQACAHKISGRLRIVAGPDDCRRSEVPISWNVSGAAGEPGPPGPPGDTPNDDVRRIADLVGRSGFAEGLPIGLTQPVECSGTLVFTAPDGGQAGVVGMIGTDRVSETFAYHLALGGALAPSSAWLGQIASVEFQRDEGATTFSGIVTEVGSSGDAGGMGFTVVTIEPPVAVLRANADHRLFQTANVVDIIEQLLTEGEVPFGLSITGDYPTRDCTAQYNESDLNFLTRLAEEEGIFLYFDDNGMVFFGDSPGGFGAISASLPYPGGSPPAPDAEFVATVQRGGWFTANRATVRGFDFENSSVLIEGTASVDDGLKERYSYNGSVRTNPVADDRAAVALERVLIPRDLIAGTSSSADLRAGRGLAIVDSSAGGFDGQYIVTGVTHAFSSDATGCLSYGNVFEAIPEGTPFRPQRVTPKPRVQGPDTAIVTGPPGATTFADELGRVKVQFHWDRDGMSNEDSSCWIRVAQASPSGSGEPAFIPEVGDEVLVGYMEGDPDRPVVLGTVYNDQHPPPSPP